MVSKETCRTLAKVETPQTHTLKAKKVPLFPPLKTRPNLPMPQISMAPSAEPATGKTESLKLGSENVEVSQPALQDLLTYKSEEMKYPSSELGYGAPEKNEKKKRGRKRKSDMDFKPAEKTPKFLSDYVLSKIST